MSTAITLAGRLPRIGIQNRTLILLASTLWLTATTLAAAPQTQPALPEEAKAKLDAHRLIGKAHYENDKFAEAADEFRRCIELLPASATDHFNLAIVLMRAQDYEASLAALDDAQQSDPKLLAVYYIRGIIHKRQGQYADAVTQLKHVTKHDPGCQGAYYNLGVCHKFLKQYEDAIAAFKKEEELSPTDPSTQYQLITLYRRTGQVDNAERHTEIYDRVKATIDEAQKTAEALERSKYTYIINAPKLTEDVKPASTTGVRFVDVTEACGFLKPLKPFADDANKPSVLPDNILTPEIMRDGYVPYIGGAIALADYDNDGDLDLYVVNCATDPEQSKNRLYQNEGPAKFVDATLSAGVGDEGLGLDAVFGDYDNDGHIDLYVANCSPNVLYRSNGDGTFTNVSKPSRAAEPQFGRVALFIDYDHDNDLDIFLGNYVDFASLKKPLGNRIRVPEDFSGQADTLLRNNGNGTFTDQTDEAGLLVGLPQTRAAIAADFDADHDTDLLTFHDDVSPRLFANARLGKFVSGGSFSPPIPPEAAATAEGDFNRDGHPDLVIALGDKLYLYANDGKASFTGTRVALPASAPSFCPTRICVFDYNNDGWSDLLLGGTPPDVRHPAPGERLCSLLLLAGDANGAFQDATSPTGLDTCASHVTDIAAADLDNDGDQDIVLHALDRGPIILRNDGGNAGHWLRVRLVGKKVNRSAYGATVEIASGGHYQKQTYRDGPVHFGLGKLDRVDVVRVTWPNGVAQNVIRPKINDTLTIEEYVKVSASCGFLYTYNGRGFELVNEILGIGPLGVPMAPGVYHQPDCTELTKIEAAQLAPKDGFYDIRLTEELREITYADAITFRVVDHPAELEIVPNEYFTAPPFPEDKLFAVANHRPPRSAANEHGADVLDLIRTRDNRFPTFAMTPYDGLAEPHSLTLDLGDLANADGILLCLDGWIYWAESSVAMAIAQDPRFEMTPLELEVRDASGNWRTAIESVGLPTSKGIVVPVDLTNRFLCSDYHVRLSTNLCIYFDRIFVATRDESGRCRQTELPVAHADLHYRGFSRMTRDALGFERFDYETVSPTGSWGPPQGMLTRYGDVTPLLTDPDDMYVIFGPGDELALRFDARHLPDLATGWSRDFIFYANGWVKDGDLNTKFSETVTPLPFHAMTTYPYGPDEHYPDTPEHQRYLREYNTRPASPTVGRLCKQK